MRKLIFLSILAIAFSSCSNVGKYKEAIDSLSSEWETTTSQVTSAVDLITQAQEQAKTALESMNPSEEVAAALSEEQTTKLGTLKEMVQAQMGDMGGLAQQAFEFVTKWQEQGEQLTALKDGLAGGKLPSDVQGTIDNLKGMVGSAEENVATWTSKVSSTQDAIASATQSYNAMMASIGGGN